MSEITRTTSTARPVRVTTTAAPSTPDTDRDRDALNTYRVSCDTPGLPVKPAPMPPPGKNGVPDTYRCVRCDRTRPLAAFPIIVPSRGVRSWWCASCEQKGGAA